MEDRVKDFLKNRTPKLCVLATASNDAKPESAVVGYSVKDDLTIIVSTDKSTRKIQNISGNPKVALIIGWSFTEQNVQYEGNAKIISEGNDYAECEEFFFSQNPEAKKFKGPNTVFITIHPTWIRLLDPSQPPPNTEEKIF